MFKKNLYLVLLSAALIVPVAAVEMMEMVGMDLPEDMEITDAEVRSCKCKKFRCINVCGGANIGGNLTVGGSVTANSFITPSGLLFNGLRNYAVLSNQAALTVDDTDTVLWAATTENRLSSGITVDNITGDITLPTTGIFLVQYSVRLNRTPFNGDSNVTVQLLQAGLASQVAITQNNSADGVTQAEPASQTEVTGYALVIVTSSLNNTIRLDVTLPAGGATVPAATLNDANAQMTILQLN